MRIIAKCDYTDGAFLRYTKPYMTHYIYIPGFGDHFNPLRRFALRRWEKGGAKVTLVPMHWSNKQETYEQKYARLVSVIQSVKSDDIRLVGESAGAAMAIHTFSHDTERFTQVVTICGYSHTASDIIAFQRRRHTAFYPLVDEVDRALELLSPTARQRITTLYSRRDRMVDSRYSRIDGAKEIVLSTPGHAFSISYVLLRTLSHWL